MRSEDLSSGSKGFWVAEGLFRLFALKPALGVLAALINREWLARNEAGIPAVLPEAVSFILLVLAFRCRGELYLSRVWAWVILLASAGFSNRAFRDCGDDGITTPEIEWLIVLPVAHLVFTGAFIRLLKSWSPIVRWGTCGILISLVPLVPLIWEKYPAHAPWAAGFVYGGFLLSAGAGAVFFNLTREAEL